MKKIFKLLILCIASIFVVLFIKSIIENIVLPNMSIQAIFGSAISMFAILVIVVVALGSLCITNEKSKEDTPTKTKHSDA